MIIQILTVRTKADVQPFITLGRELTKRSIFTNNFMINGKDGSVKWLD